MNNKIAAVYCVYEDSGFLHESVRRIYPLMDKIIFLVNQKPWTGKGDPKYIQETFTKISDIFDPEKKLQVISSYWESEAEQRNFGLDFLATNSIGWCFIIDDDEMYNYADLKKAIQEKIFKEENTTAYLSPHQIYWKTEDFCIDKIALALPSFCRTDRQKVYFNEARAVVITQGNWVTFFPSELVCHHYSYVRSNEQMKRKIENFSHADASLEDWYNNVWLQWGILSKNLHPNKDAPDSFHKAIPISESPYKLEPINFDKHFERYLQSFKVKSHQNLTWLKSDNSRLVEFLYAFITEHAKKNRGFSVYSDKSDYLYYTCLEAILKSGYMQFSRAYHKDDTTRTHNTYHTFCTRNETVQDLRFDLIFKYGEKDLEKLPETKFLITDNLGYAPNRKNCFKFSDNLYLLRM